MQRLCFILVLTISYPILYIWYGLTVSNRLSSGTVRELRIDYPAKFPLDGRRDTSPATPGWLQVQTDVGI